MKVLRPRLVLIRAILTVSLTVLEQKGRDDMVSGIKVRKALCSKLLLMHTPACPRTDGLSHLDIWKQRKKLTNVNWNAEGELTVQSFHGRELEEAFRSEF